MDSRQGLIATVGGALFLAAGMAQADVTGVFDTPDGQVTLEVRDADNLRFRTPDGSFLVVSRGEAFMLGRGNDGWMAMPVSEIPAAGGSPEEVRFRATGDRETVAGIRGEVYRMERGDSWADDWQPAGDAVFSTDPRARELGQGFVSLMQHFSATGELETAFGDVDGIDLDRQGMLRVNNDLVLVSLDDSRIADRNFQLPPNVQMMSGPGRGAASSYDGGADEQREPGWFGRQVQGTGEDARDDAAGETRREIRDNVRDGVRSLFR